MLFIDYRESHDRSPLVRPLSWMNRGVFTSVAGRQAAAVIYETYLLGGGPVARWLHRRRDRGPGPSQAASPERNELQDPRPWRSARSAGGHIAMLGPLSPRL